MTTGGLSLSFSLATAQLPVRAFSGRPEWRASDDVTTGALTITYTILGVPCCNYSRIGPKTLFYLIRASILGFRVWGFGKFRYCGVDLWILGFGGWPEALSPHVVSGVGSLGPHRPWNSAARADLGLCQEPGPDLDASRGM